MFVRHNMLKVGMVTVDGGTVTEVWSVSEVVTRVAVMFGKVAVSHRFTNSFDGLEIEGE